MPNTQEPQKPQDPQDRDTYARPLYPVAPFEGGGTPAEVVMFGGFPFVRLQAGPWQLDDSGRCDTLD